MSLKSQRLAQAAYARVEARQRSPDKYCREYRSFAREFPTLVHQCGLAQAVAFAQAKKEHQADYVNDLAAVLRAAGHDNAATPETLASQTRSLPVAGYVRLKRYVEALFEDKQQGGGR
jgi:CRISPR-associated protein Cmr5